MEESFCYFHLHLPHKMMIITSFLTCIQTHMGANKQVLKLILVLMNYKSQHFFHKLWTISWDIQEFFMTFLLYPHSIALGSIDRGFDVSISLSSSLILHIFLSSTWGDMISDPLSVIISVGYSFTTAFSYNAGPSVTVGYGFYCHPSQINYILSLSQH